jgi:hypothetical protein
MSGDGVTDRDDVNSDLDIDETDLESFSTMLEMKTDIDEFDIFSRSLQRSSQMTLFTRCCHM